MSSHSVPGAARGDWQSAPGVVKGWAYPLTWHGHILWQWFKPETKAWFAMS